MWYLGLELSTCRLTRTTSLVSKHSLVIKLKHLEHSENAVSKCSENPYLIKIVKAYTAGQPKLEVPEGIPLCFLTHFCSLYLIS